MKKGNMTHRHSRLKVKAEAIRALTRADAAGVVAGEGGSGGNCTSGEDENMCETTGSALCRSLATPCR